MLDRTNGATQMAPTSDSGEGRSDNNNRGKKNRRVSRRFTLIPLSNPSAFIHPIEDRQVFKVIELAEADAKAEIARRASGSLRTDTGLMPAFGDDVSHLLPSKEYRRLVAFIDARQDDLRAKLIVIKWVGRENIDPTPDTLATLLERAREMIEYAGDYLAGKSRLAMYLRRGLKKLHDAENRRK